MKFKLFFILIIIFSLQPAIGQDSTRDITKMTKEDVLNLTYDELLEMPLEDLLILADKLGISIDELLNTKVTVGTKTELTARETPGIITVITSDEIRKTGARDLVDVLQTVPGLHFGYDLDGAIGLAMRGNWGYEGKILVLLDGQEMNEGMYSTANFGRHYPVENIDRIEIVRGAGSAIYGGYAELGVINIITKDAAKVNGVMGSVTYGQMGNTTGIASTQLSTGIIKEETSLIIHAFYGAGNRSDKTITDFYGDEYDLGDDYSGVEEKNINIGLTSKPVNIRFIYDDYATRVTQYSEDATNRFQNILGEINQTYRINKKITLTPRIQVKSQLPYNMEEEDWFYRKRFSRLNGNAFMKYDVNSKLNFLGGIDYFQDFAVDKDGDPETVFFPNEEERISFNNTALFIQGLYQAGVINFIAGSRVDYHSHAGLAFSPRAGITGIINVFHYKLLFSQAFRAPSIENISLNTDIKPERTTSFELETGVKLSRYAFVTANFFDIAINDPIVYRYFPGTEELDYSDESESYENFNRSGTRGFELESKLLYKQLFASISYSFYSAAGKNEVELYSAIDDDGSINLNALQGFPQHKITALASYSITDDIIFSANITYQGRKYGFLESDSLQSLLAPTLLINAFIEFRNIAKSGISVGLGVHNLLDEDIWIVQPYSSAESPYFPYPEADREIMIRVRYDLGWKKN